MKNSLEIAISLVAHEHQLGKNSEKRYGLASNYYLKMNENWAFNKLHQTRLLVRESNFKLPLNSNVPIVMICTGTGIAPFISFLQELKSNNSKRNTYLLFGSKNSDSDFIYKDEIASYCDEGYLKEFDAIFSRDFCHLKLNDKKEISVVSDESKSSLKYVQDLLPLKEETFKKMLLKSPGVLYICGGVNMGNDVMKKIEFLYGATFVKQLENEKRIIKELWG